MASHKLEMLKTNRGKDMLLIDGFLYHYCDRNSKGYRWVCSRRKRTPCRVWVYTSLEEEWDVTRHQLDSIIGKHTHEPASMDTIIRARDKKQFADEQGLPCTISNRTLKRKYQLEARTESATKKKSKTLPDDSFDDIIEELDENYVELPNYVAVDKEVLMMKTPRGVHMIGVEGFVYRLDGKSMITCTYRWRCYRAKDLQCPGRIYTECLSNGQHRYKPFRLEENKHNHKPYTEAKLSDMIRRNHIQILEQNSAQTNFKEKEKIEKKLRQSPTNMHTKDAAENVLSNNVEITPIYKTRAERINDLAALYRFVSDPMKAVEKPKDSNGVTKFSFLSSSKGKRVMLMDNILYHYNARASRNDRTSWTCMYRRDKNWKCKSRVTTQKTSKQVRVVKVYGSHAHRNDHRCHIDKQLKWNLGQFQSEQYREDQGEDKNSLYLSDNNDDSDVDSIGNCKLKQEETAFDGISEFLQFKREQVSPTASLETIESFEDSSQSMIEDDKTADPFHDTIDYLGMDEYVDSLNRWMNISSTDSEQGHDNSTNKSKTQTEHNVSPKVRKQKSKLGKTAANTYDAVPKKSTKNAVKTEKKSNDDYEDFQITENPFTVLSNSNENIISMTITKQDENDDNNYYTDYEESVGISKLNKSPSNSYDSDDIDVNVNKIKQPRRLNKRAPYNIRKKFSNPDNIDITNISKLRSKIGGELLCVDGFIYHLKSLSNKTRAYWACIKSRDQHVKCPARLTTQSTEDNEVKVIRLSHSHSHAVSEKDIKKRLFNEFSTSSTKKSSLRSTNVLGKRLDKLNPECLEMLGNKVQNVKTNQESEINMKLYAVSDGPPSLAVRMCLKALNIPYELHNVNFINSEHMTDEYAKMNPQKEIPVLDDDGFYLSESIAIMQYLCDKYCNDTTIYPRDAKERALINHRLCFNMAFYYSNIGAYSMAPIFFDYQRTDMGLRKVTNSLHVFETYLKRSSSKYAAGDKVTIADFALVSATLCLEAIEFDFSDFPLITKWYQTFKKENPELWAIGNDGMQEIIEFEKNPPDLSHMNHPFHPTRKSNA